MQSVKRSWYEAWTNILIGYGVNYVANLIILPMFGFTSLTVAKNLELGVIYTVISLLRQFCVRRWFNKKDGDKNATAKQ